MLRKSIILLLLPLTLSAFTHLWNPVGFPDIFYDEGVYMRRAMHVLQGLGPQESATYYDHPYFGQLFLGGIFKIIGYPDSIHSSGDINSIQTLYLVPRVLMGLLAIIDTFLIYKITETRYSRNVAFIASILFAVMPLSWLTRRILLDSILLPLVLSSILLALYAREKDKTNAPKNQDNGRRSYDAKRMTSLIFSGVFLGLSIFTKIPIFTTIPIVAYIIFMNSNRSWKSLGIWFIPVVLISLIWPAYSIAVGQFDPWLEGIFNQTDRDAKFNLNNFAIFLKLDPFLFILGIIGIVFAMVRRDWFIVIWVIPNLAFHFIIHYFPYREMIPFIPIFCISSALVLSSILGHFQNKKQRIFQAVVISAIATFGLLSTIALITTNLTSSQFQVAAFVSNFLNSESNINDNFVLVSTPIYSWIFKYVQNHDNVLDQYRDVLSRPIKSDNVLLIADSHFMGAKKSDKKFAELYNSTYVLSGFTGQRKNFDTRDYPYSNMVLNNEGANVIEIRIRDNSTVNSHLANCIKYEMSSIKISCKSADLLDVYNILHAQNPKVLSKEAPKSWILNANLEINNGSNFYVNSTNTSWLKVNSTGGLIHSIKVHGNLAIDHVKITGWDYEKNNYPPIDQNGTNPRSHIIIDDGVGRTNITNSEIAYLGYRKSSGLSYNTGIGSMINNNTIHDLWHGINSQGNLSDLTIENNRFYNNSIYGIYLHDGTHDIDIRNNKVYNNGRHGIICSTDCHNITLGSNQIFNNTKQGILLSNNASNSMIRNNMVYNNTDQIAIYDFSINNQIYNNTISGGKVGIRLNTGSAHTHIYNNSLANSSYGVYLLQGASNNIIEMNKIINASDTAIFVKDNTTNNNVFKDNFLLNNRKNEIDRNSLISNKNLFINNTKENLRPIR